MELFQVAAPDLSGLAVGEPTLRYIEGVGFTRDDRLLLVKATFTDSGDVSGGLKYGYFVFDVDQKSYLADVNQLVAGQGNADAISVGQAIISGTFDDWSVFATVSLVGQDSESLAQVSAAGVVQSDLIALVAGAPFVIAIERMKASSDGRYLVIQTSDEPLADNPPDTNDSPDIYLLDTEGLSVTRVSLAAGAEATQPTYLEDLRLLSSGALQVLFSTDAAFVNPRLDGNGGSTATLGARDLYLWESQQDGSGGLTEPTITLITSDANGLALGFVDSSFAEARISDAGVFFASSSAIYDDNDGNQSLDALLASGENISRLLPASAEDLDQGAIFLGAGESGSTAYLLSESSELGGAAGVPQVFRLNTDSGEVDSVSVPEGITADNAAIDAVISSSGNLAAFTSLASNLTVTDPASLWGSLFIAEFPPNAISGAVYHWANHALLPGASVTLSSVLESGDLLQLSAGTSAEAGVFSLENRISGNALLSGSLSADSISITDSVDIQDALAALKIAVGVNPNTDPDGSGPLERPPISPYQLIAADVNEDGEVDIRDALEILKMAVGLSTATPQEWKLVPQAETFWDESLQAFTIDGDNVAWSSQGLEIAGEPPLDANFVAVLTGDVNGSWEPPLESVALERTYFEGLAAEGYGPLEKWSLFPIA